MTAGGPVEAIVLVGGQGTRLRPLTLATPKPMLPVAGVPFLTHQLDRLRTVGVEHVVLATSYRAETFEQHFGTGASLGLRIDYAVEDEPLGTGGAIRNAGELLTGAADDPVVVLNGDVVSGHDLPAQLALHRRHDADVTLHLVVVDDARSFGCVPTDDAGRVTAFLEKMNEPVSNQINAGCYIMRRGVISAIPPRRVVSVERDTFPALLDGDADVRGYVESAYWLDVGTPAALVRASADLVTGAAGTGADTDDSRALLADGVRCGEGAVVTGGSALGERVEVGERATVDASIVGTGSVIGADAQVVRCALGTGVVVGARTRLVDVVVADGVRLGADVELLHGARVWPGVTLPDGAVRFSSDA